MILVHACKVYIKEVDSANFTLLKLLRNERFLLEFGHRVDEKIHKLYDSWLIECVWIYYWNTIG